MFIQSGVSALWVRDTIENYKRAAYELNILTGEQNLVALASHLASENIFYDVCAKIT